MTDGENRLLETAPMTDEEKRLLETVLLNKVALDELYRLNFTEEETQIVQMNIHDWLMGLGEETMWLTEREIKILQKILLHQDNKKCHELAIYFDFISSIDWENFQKEKR